MTLNLTITDDFTPSAGISVTARAARVDNSSVEDLSVVTAPTLSAPDAAGNRALTVTGRSSGDQVDVHQCVGLMSERVFMLTLNPVADVPMI